MSTSWAELITNYAMVEIDDQRLNDLISANPSQFFRKMSLYVKMALPLLNRPPELRQYLTYGMVDPQFADAEWVSTENSTAVETTVTTGKLGFALFSCSIVSVDASGNVGYAPYGSATYDPESGNVVFPKQSAEGITYTMDFYTDGSFENDFTLAQKRLIGLGIAQVWYEHFAGNWLNMQPKISDRNFSTASESPHIQAMTARLKDVRANLSSELRKYEQDCAVSSILPNRTVNLI